MKLLQQLISLALLFSMHNLTTKQGGVGNIAQPQPVKNIPAVQAPPQPQMQPQQQVMQQKITIQKPQNYAQALAIIKTLPSAMVIINNTINPNFISLVKSFNFTDIETKALIEAGANIHTSWTTNEQMNKQIVSSLKNAISVAMPGQPTKPARPAIPAQPIPVKKQTPAPQPAQPMQQQKPIAAPTPVQPAMPIAQPSPTQNYSLTNNLAMALDPRKKETIETAAEAVFQQALIALYYKSSAVIMTNNIFEMIITVRQRIGEQNLQKLKTAGFQELFNLAQQLVQGVKIPGVSYISAILLSSIVLDSNNFNCYFHTSENLVLLIPKEYIRANMPQALHDSLADQARACGFNPRVLRSVTDLSNENILKQLAAEKKRPTVEKDFISNLAAMFAIQKKNGQLISPQQNSKWIMYIIGHGGPAHMDIGTAREHYNTIKQSIANARHNIAMGGRLSPQLKKQAEDYLREYEPRLKEYEQMLEGRSDWQDNQMVPESALIAGVTAPEFAQLMTFFDQSLDTAFVHYISCFAGGSNQTFVNETLSDLKVKFIVSTQGAQESYASAQIGVAMRSDKPGVEITGQNFSEFFSLLRTFFTQGESAKKGKPQDQIRKIIATVSSDDKPQNQPFVRFPEAGFFEAMPTTRQTKIITKQMAKDHESKNKPFDFSDPRINVVIIQTTRITVPIDFGKKAPQGHLAIVTPSPARFVPGYEGLLLLKNVNWQDTMQSLLFNLSYLNNSMYPQTFVINTLKGVFLEQSGIANKQDTVIKNFIMNMRGITGKGAGSGPAVQLTPVTPETIRIGHVGSNIHIAFELGDIIYQCFFAIRDIENTEVLQNNIDKLVFTAIPKKSMNMDTFAQNFLTQQEIAQVQKPITLESIATLVNDKINKQNPSMTMWSDADQEAVLKTVRTKARK